MHAFTLNSRHAFVPDSPAGLRPGVVLAVAALHVAALAWFAQRHAPRPVPTAPVVVTLYAESPAMPRSAPTAEPKARSTSPSRPTAVPTVPSQPVDAPRDTAPVLATDATEGAVTTAAAPAASVPAPSAAGGATGSVAPRPAPAAAPVTPPVFSADYLQNPTPAYPNLARRQGQQGRVVLRVLVNATGLAEQLEVRTSSGHALLDGAALDAVRRWRFVPARQGQEPVPAWVLIPLNFSLQG